MEDKKQVFSNLFGKKGLKDSYFNIKFYLATRVISHFKKYLKADHLEFSFSNLMRLRYHAENFFCSSNLENHLKKILLFPYFSSPPPKIEQDTKWSERQLSMEVHLEKTLENWFTILHHFSKEISPYSLLYFKVMAYFSERGCVTLWTLGKK